MSALIRPKKNSPIITLDGANSEKTILYSITNTNNDATAESLLIANAPSFQTVSGIPLTKKVLTLRAVDYGAYDAEAKYSFAGLEREPLQEGESSYQFETAGGTIHITKALNEEVYPLASSSDYGLLIGNNGDEPAGCDIVAPVFSFSETHVLSAATVNATYKGKLFSATGTVNAGSFKGFDPGEVLFLGASGTSRGDSAWQINYRFLASKNETGLTIGAITGIAKKGHEYLWVKFVDGDSNDIRVKQILEVVVNGVYKTHDFSNIGIGT